MSKVRHKCFLSYHHDDRKLVDEFIETFDYERSVFITRGLGLEMADEIIDSDNADYVMRRIRALYLKDSTVTIVLIGKCTWARRYVDWEIQASLRHGETVTPNGLLGIKLIRSAKRFPNRLVFNLIRDDDQEDCYARWIEYPRRKDMIASAIEDAFQARTLRAELIENPRERFSNNRECH